MFLKHRDKELLRFEWVEPQGGVLSPFISYEELSDVLVIPLRTLARRMKELSEVGSIRRVGAAKNGHWEVNMI